MFNLSAVEVLVILVAALIILGPERLPGAARKIGQMMSQVRDLSSNFQREVQSAMTIPEPSSEKPHTRPHLTAIDGGLSSDVDIDDPIDTPSPIETTSVNADTTADAVADNIDAVADNIDAVADNIDAEPKPAPKLEPESNLNPPDRPSASGPSTVDETVEGKSSAIVND